jgi:hypothetical protein
MAGALLGAVLSEVATLAPSALSIDPGFGADGADTGGDVLFIPTPDALATVLSRLGLAP